MTQLVGRHPEVHAVDHIGIVGSLFSQLGSYGVGYFLPVKIAGIGTFSGAADDYLLPQIPPLRPGERNAITVGNDIIACRGGLLGAQMICEDGRNRNIPLGCRGFKSL